MPAPFRRTPRPIVAVLASVAMVGCLGIHDLTPPDTTDASMLDAPAEASVANDADASILDAPADGTLGDTAMGAEGGGQACVSGATCNPTDCQTGTFECIDAGGKCVKSANLADGTPCGAGDTSVCHAGVCGTCASGSDCTDMTNPCVKKTVDCSSGQAVCKVAMNAPDGTPCTNGQYCYTGVCSACMVGNACSPAGNPCHTGKVTSCAGGTMTCTDQNTPAPAGASCQASGVPSGVCDGQGTCAACTPNATCSPPGKPCQQGTMTCTSGPTCASPVNINEGKSCGSGPICSAGACVACSATSCASGCCDATGCVTGAQTGNNCGTKGAACAACSSGQVCTMGGGGCSCPPTASTSCGGTCTNTQTDAKNCGTCGHDCTVLKNVSGPVSCVAGACSVPPASCAAGWMHCSANVNDGCETDITKPGTCGGCTTVCPATAPQCSGSGNSYRCVTGCSAPTPTLCGSTCVDTTSNASYCGNCMTACTGGMTCQSSQCKCPAGKLDCNGTCEDPSPQNGCGGSASCMACPGPTSGSGAASCNMSSCAISCSASTPTLCGSSCVDTTSNSSRCGNCATACSGGMTCQSSQCKCPAGQVNCSGVCQSPSPQNGCGSSASCTACPGPTTGSNTGAPSCSAASTCTISCTAPTSQPCGTGCFNTSNDSNNCGGCAVTCSSSQKCSGGACMCSSCSQNDQHCAGAGCVCDLAYMLACGNGQNACGGWGFENGTAEGWAVFQQQGQVNNGSGMATLIGVVNFGGSQQLAVKALPDPTNGGVAFWIQKDVCSGSTAGASNMKVSFTVSSDVVQSSNNDDFSTFVTVAGQTQPAGGDIGLALPGPSTYTGANALASGTVITQVGIEVQIYNAIPAGGMTIYFDNIHIN